MATTEGAGGAGRTKRPTATDVARRAGVSQATVSYVLNNNPRQAIPETTRRRVLTAADELGYTPSAAARIGVPQDADRSPPRSASRRSCGSSSRCGWRDCWSCAAGGSTWS